METEMKSIEELIESAPIGHLEEGQREKIKQLIRNFEGIMAKHELDIGVTDKLTVYIPVNDPKAYFQMKYTPIPRNLHADVKKILDQFKKAGIIAECHDPRFITSLMVVLKRSGKPRIIFDGRLLNSITQTQPGTIPSLPELMSHLKGADWVTFLDLSNAYFAIPIAEKDQFKTAFLDQNRGMCCFKVLPQGYKNSAAALDKLMFMVLGPIEEAVHYMDDIIIATKGTFDEHLKVLGKVFEGFRWAKIKIKPEKIQFACDHFEFLGIYFKKDYAFIPEARIQGFKSLPIPKTQRAIKSFIGSISYYRKWVARFAELTLPLQEALLIEKSKFKLDAKLIDAFHKCIKAIGESTAIFIPDEKAPFYCYSDASDKCLSFVVHQKDEATGEMRLVGASSRKLSVAEQNYSTFKKEACAIMYGLQSFHFYLMYAPKITLYTDAKSILFLKFCKQSSSYLMRMALSLSLYNIDLVHIPGEENVVADYLSRNHQALLEEADKLNLKPATEKEAVTLLQKLTLPEYRTYTPEQVKKMLYCDSLPSADQPLKKTKKQPSAATGKHIAPQSRRERLIKLPRNARASFDIPKPKKKLKKGFGDINAITTRSGIDFGNNASVGQKDKTKRRKEAPLSAPSSVERALSAAAEGAGCQQEQSTNIDGIVTQPVSFEAAGDADRSGVNGSRLQEAERALLSYAVVDLQDLAVFARMLLSGAIAPDDFIVSQDLDVILQQAKSKQPNKFERINGILMVKPTENRKMKIAIPANLLRHFALTKHYTLKGIHRMAARICDEVSDYYWHPNMKEIVKEVTNNCFFCIANRPSRLKKHIVCENYQPQMPREGFAFDISGGWLPNKGKETYIYIFVCLFSNYIILVPAASKSSAEIEFAFKRYIIQCFGRPRILRSDREPGIVRSVEFEQFLAENDIVSLPTAAHSPQSNGSAEMVVQKVKEILRVVMQQTNSYDDWADHLWMISLAQNSTKQIYGYTPEEIMFGKKLEDVDIGKLQGNVEAQSHDAMVKYFGDFISRLNEIHSSMQRLRSKLRIANAASANRSRKERHFDVGDVVMAKDLALRQFGAIRAKNDGPYLVESIEPSGNTAIIRNLTNQKSRKVHFDHLFRCPTDFRDCVLPQGWDKELLKGLRL